MKVVFLILFILISIELRSQIIETYELKDSALVIGEKNHDNNISQQKLDIEDLYSNGFVNTDLMNYLRVIGINSSLDFNAVPYMEGADFYEQQFFINNIPVPFQSRLIGLESGLNTLMFSQLSILETQSLGIYNKPIKMRVKTITIDTSKSHFKSDINILHFENTVTLPIIELNGGIAIGYNRSLLETIKPFLANKINSNNFEYEKFPSFQGFQALGEFRLNNVLIMPILIYTGDIGNFGLIQNQFNFNTHELNYGVDVQTELNDLSISSQIYSNTGNNIIDYHFNETNNSAIIGNGNLYFRDYGFNNNFDYLLTKGQNLIFSLGYKHQSTRSDNMVLYSDSSKNVSASYLSGNFESSISYQNLISDKILSTIHIGLNSFIFEPITPTVGLDIYYSDPKIFDARFQINYESSQEPINPIFYSFQNIIWDPSSTSSLFFVDSKNLPLKPIKALNTSLNFRKQINNSFINTNLSIKLYFRKLNNLLYSNSYPDEITNYNTDFDFNQHYKGIRYGLSLMAENDIPSLSLKNITSFNLCVSINHNLENGLVFYALNYSPFSITNYTQYRIDNFYINLLFAYSSGRYLFSKKISSNYSLTDSTYRYSMSTDYSSQQNLTPYYRMDIYLLYKVIKGDFNLDLGFSLLNVFDHKNETSRYYDYDSSNKTIIVKSEYFNFPRFIIFEIKMNYTF